jgi:hypothetical protein
MGSLSAYVRSGKDRIEGWFGRIDSEIFCELLTHQNEQKIAGGVAEIGLHHGKAFVALCLALAEGQRAYGIDLFEDQARNLDASGRGDRAVLEGHLRAFGVDAARVVLDARASEAVKPQDLLDAVGPVRFFSVDGGHWHGVVVNDLRLAEQVLAEGGVIALDDFLRHEWPDVSGGFFDWFQHGQREIVPFALGYNKLYLCHRHRVEELRGRLERSAFLRHFLAKHQDFCGQRIPVFQSYPLAEWGVRTRAREYVKLYHPDLYVKLRTSLGR